MVEAVVIVPIQITRVAVEAAVAVDGTTSTQRKTAVEKLLPQRKSAVAATQRKPVWPCLAPLGPAQLRSALLGITRTRVAHGHGPAGSAGKS